MLKPDWDKRTCRATRKSGNRKWSRWRKALCSYLSFEHFRRQLFGHV